jgi:hypothetical protein
MPGFGYLYKKTTQTATTLTLKTPLRFANLRANVHTPISLVGIVLIIIFSIQLVSGIMIALSLVSDSLSIPSSRSEEDQDDLYTDDFFWAHERGVD